MAQFLIMSKVGKTKKYLSIDSGAWWWSTRLADALIIGTQTQANHIFESITKEEESVMSDGSVDAPNTLRRLAGICNDNKCSDIIISVCAISIVPLNTQRWHVEDGKGKTKRLS